jgi:adenosyl cobinamide kinase/adenosyl cobinamide phosphate guanylyltransferase
VVILILGGARSGKSSLAQTMARRWEATTAPDSRDGSAVTMIATAPEIPGDLDLSARINTHRAERPAHWATVEEPENLIGTLHGTAIGSGLVIIDCLTLWVNNLLWRGDTAEQVIRTATETAQVAAARRAPVIAVSNEVGLGIHPASAEGREFRDLLGRVNAIWATHSDRTMFLIAGKILPLHDPSLLLEDIFPDREDPQDGR